jgi:cobalt/nickel transport system permease protein
MSFVTAIVFAAQMFNFSVAQGMSGHLLGGVFAALFLGPWGGALSITMVLLVQATLYADGGLIVLGANIVNMAFFGTILGYGIYHVLHRQQLPSKICIGFAAWASLVLASVACALELGMSGTVGLQSVLLSMISTHAIIGIGEMLITLLLVSVMVNMMGWQTYGHEI